MSYCTECYSVEQGFHYEDDDEDGVPICNTCEMEDTRVFVDEDYGKDE